MKSVTTGDTIDGQTVCVPCICSVICSVQVAVVTEDYFYPNIILKII